MEEITTPTETPKELSDLEKLKAQNAEFEKELMKAREMQAEKQKLDAELLLSGTAGERPNVEEPKQITNEEYADKLMRGEVNPLGDDDISIN